MGEVVNLPLSGRRDLNAASERAAEDKKRLAEEDRRRCRTLREQMKRLPPMRRVSDRQSAGESLWRLLARLKQQGISKSEVVRKAGLGDGDPKVLATYQLDPGLPENERKKRARKLTQNPRKYLRIIEAAAELANADPEQFTWDVFGSTSFAHAPGRELTEEEEVRRLGLECLETACQRIATELELKKWGERASAAGLVWTMSGWHQFGGSRPSDSSFEGATRADYPRAPLYLLEVCRGKSHAFDPQSGSTLEVEIFYGQRVFIALVGTRPAILRQAATVVEGDDQRIEVCPGCRFYAQPEMEGRMTPIWSKRSIQRGSDFLPARVTG